MAGSPAQPIGEIMCYLLVRLTLTAMIVTTAPAVAQPAPTANMPVIDQTSFAPVLEKAMPAVVRIQIKGVTRKERPILLSNPAIRSILETQGVANTDGTEQFSSTGSGIIIDAEKGLVMTNFHVIEDAKEISVHLYDGREMDAELVGQDPATDVAALRIPAIRLTALPYANSLAVKVGDPVLAIGNPLGLDFTATKGMVSALLRSGIGYRTFEGYIQHDAPVNSGNSGGALINLKGELIGMNTAIRSPSGGSVGLGFAVPSGLALRVFEQLVRNGKVNRGHIGAKVTDVSRQLGTMYGITSLQGAFVTHVKGDSPAAKAGLEFADVITHVTLTHPFTGEKKRVPIAHANKFETALAVLSIGETIGVEYNRFGATRTTSMVVADMRPDPDRLTLPASVVRMAGVVVESLPVTDPLFGQVRGVEVIEVPKGSIAEIVGLRPNDIITAIEQDRVRTVEDVLTHTRRRQGKFDMSILRDRAPYKLEFPL
jgi:serine protease Do/serine protease DegQ